MSKKKNIDLEPIIYDEELSSFYFDGNMDEVVTQIFMDDYDWMSYVLYIKFPSNKYGEMEIVFSYFGCVRCTMGVKIGNIEVHAFEFDYHIFKRNIKRFLRAHIKHWDSKYAFSGLKEGVEFYNEVIEDRRTKEVKDYKNELQRIADSVKLDW